MLVPFRKYSACGNDFILIDDREKVFPERNSELIAKLCHRRLGIGADGLILLSTSIRADFRMRIFNADASEAEMCGNGIRCLLPFLKELGVSGNTFRIETMQRVLHISARDVDVAVEMGPAVDVRWDVNVPVGNCLRTGHYLNTGVPHFVIFVDDIETVDVAQEGRAIRHHKLFSPQGVNVNYVSTNRGVFALRTYERGVEGETLACGTGATATALAIAKTTGMGSPISMTTRSSDRLTISFQRDGDAFSHIELCGPASCTYQGEVSLFKQNVMGYDSVR